MTGCQTPTPYHAALVESARGLADALAYRYSRQYGTITKDDLRQVALVALTESALRFDESRGVPFVGFARPHVWRAILHTVRSEVRTFGLVGYKAQLRAARYKRACALCESRGVEPTTETMVAVLGWPVEHVTEAEAFTSDPVYWEDVRAALETGD